MALKSRSSNAHHERDLGTGLPLIYDEGPQVGAAVAALVFGGIFTAFPVLFYVLASLGDEPLPWPAYLLLGVFLLIGTLIELVGVNALLHKLELHITGETVKGLRRGLKGTRSWNQPMTNYTGVYAQEEYHAGGKNRSSYTLYKVTLKHSTTKDYDVMVFCSRSGARHRDQTEAYARLFNRPVLSLQADGGFSERAVEDLDKSIGELVEERKLQVQFNPYDQPKGRLKLEKLANGYRFDHPYSTGMSTITSTIFMLLGVGLLYWYFGPGLPEAVQGSPWVVVLIGLTFTLIGLASVLFGHSTTSTLYVERDLLRTEIRFMNWTFGQKQMPSASIEEVTVGKDKQGKLVLRAASDQTSVSYGKHILSEDELMFVRNCVIVTSARARTHY